MGFCAIPRARSSWQLHRAWPLRSASPPSPFAWTHRRFYVTSTIITLSPTGPHRPRAAERPLISELRARLSPNEASRVAPSFSSRQHSALLLHRGLVHRQDKLADRTPCYSATMYSTVHASLGDHEQARSSACSDQHMATCSRWAARNRLGRSRRAYQQVVLTPVDGREAQPIIPRPNDRIRIAWGLTVWGMDERSAGIG
nr:hypothetical protein CFP56_52375 [Quercus suber]